MNDDHFLKKPAMKPSKQFTQDLLNQLHELDQQEQDMTVYTPTLTQPIRRIDDPSNKLGVIFGLVASIMILFFGVSWLNSNHNPITSKPLQVSPPRPELIQRIGEYGTFVTAAFDDLNNSATVITTTGVFRLSLDDFSTEPALIRRDTSHSAYVGYHTIQHIAQDNIMIAIRLDGTVESINIQTGDTISTWNYHDVSDTVQQTNFFHQLTNNGTRYHMPICLNSDCTQHTIATWDTTTGELIRTIEASRPFAYTQDGETLFYAQGQQVIRHDIATGEETELLTVTDQVRDIAISPDQSMIAVQNVKPVSVELFLFEMSNLDEPIFDHKTVGYEGQLSREQKIIFSEDGQYLLGLGLGNTNYRLDLNTQQINYININEMFFLSGVIPNPAQTLALRFGDNTGLELRTLEPSPQTLDQSSYFVGNTSLMSFQTFEDGVIWKLNNPKAQPIWQWIWEYQQLVPYTDEIPLPNNEQWLTPIRYSNDKRYVAYVNRSQMLYVYDHQEQKIILEQNVNRQTVNQETILPYHLVFDSENRLYAQYFDGTIDVYSLEDGLIGTIDALDDKGRLSSWDVLAPDFSAIARIADWSETGNSHYQWKIIFLDEINVIGSLIITNQVMVSPLNIPSITFSPDGTEAFISTFCSTNTPCPTMSYDNAIPDEVLIYRLSLTEFREQLLDMADLPLEERIIEYEVEEAINYEFDGVRQILHRPNHDNQIAVQTSNSVVIIELNGQEATPLYHLPSTHLFTGIYFTFSPDGNILYINQDGFLDTWKLPDGE